MKKILIVAATAGLMSLAACNSGTTNTTAENVADSHEANAAMYEAGADETSNAVQENVLDNAAAAEENAADAAHEAADNAH
jgi:protein involved in sex pheromone biosynthesis